MKPQHLIATVALCGAFLTTWAQACGLRDNGATMIDPVTGLEINKCAVGEVSLSGECKPLAQNFTRDEALQRYTNGEWRLISVEEAKQILPRSQSCPINGKITWTSSSVVGSNLFWAIAFYSPSPMEYQGIIRLPVILVRDHRQVSQKSSASSPVQLSTSFTNLDTPERLQMAQANQQQADRAFAGKRRAHDDNANTEQPTAGPSEGKATNRGPVRVNMAYCIDSYKRAYSGQLKCSAQRFGFITVEAGQTVDVLPPSSGLQALTFGCKHPAKPYDLEFVNDGLSGRCAAY